MRHIFTVYGASTLGSLCMCGLMWAFTYYGVTHFLNVALSGSLSPHWLYPRLVLGGLWGLIFLLPILPSGTLAKSLLVAAIPTAAHLFIIYPYVEHKGMAGMSLGALTPFLLYFYFWVWAIATTIILKLTR